MSEVKLDEIHANVRNAYSKVATTDNNNGSCGVPSSCCGTSPDTADFSLQLGYSAEDLANVPNGSDMGLGCGNPKAIANLSTGETVVDLGSGGGFDCFLAAREVSETGHVIGIDMTPEMISKARNNAANAGFKQVEFRLGEIENLPVADNTADCIISNCVINLSPNKKQIFAETFRILKPGGRLAISDVVASCELPDEVKNDLALHSACVSGASLIEDLHEFIKAAGFEQIDIQPKDDSRSFIKEWAPGRNIEDLVVSATIEAVKPIHE